MSATLSEPRSEPRSGIVAWLLASTDVLAEEMAAAIHDEVEELPEQLQTETVRVCRAHLSTMATLLRDGTEPRPDALPTEAESYCRTVARHAVPVGAVARKYRVAHAVLVRHATAVLSAQRLDADEFRRAVEDVLDWTFTYVDVMSRRALDAHQDELTLWMRSPEANAATETRKLLAGEQLPDHIASRRIGYELQRTHVALICWAETDHDLQSRLLAAGDLAREIAGAEGRITLELGPGRMAAWISGFAAPDIETLRTRWTGALQAKGIALALGDPLCGLGGFRRSHAQALACERVVRLQCRRTSGVHTYADVALLDVLSQNPELASDFVERELGDLAVQDDSTRRFAATLRVFYEEGSSHVATSRRLGIHSNTVAYRVRKASELLRRPVDDRLLETHVALVLLEVLRRSDPGEDCRRRRPSGATASTTRR